MMPRPGPILLPAPFGAKRVWPRAPLMEGARKLVCGPEPFRDDVALLAAGYSVGLTKIQHQPS